MDAKSVEEMFDGVKQEYKRILVGENKELLIGAIGAVNKTVSAGQKLMPPAPLILNAFKKCSWEKLRVVLVGQDPYPTPGVANGLCFSVNKDCSIPPSLKNIYAALVKSGLMAKTPSHGDISSWAEEGVLMVNMALTIINKSGEHCAEWKSYMEKVLYDIAKTCAVENKVLVFMLWGDKAQKMKKIVDAVNFETLEAKKGAIHRILTWCHPSPLAPGNKSGVDSTTHFANCDNFIACNKILAEYGASINWNVE